MPTSNGVTLLWRTDVHMADRAPQSRRDDWKVTLGRKLMAVGDIAADVNASAVLDGGDLFHVKSPTRNSHALVRYLSFIHAAYPCPTYECPGNHDVKYGDYENIDENPLGVLFESGVLKRLYDEHELMLGSAGFKVRVVGIPYHGTKYDWERFTSIKKGDEDYLVAVAHCLASPAGGEMFQNEDIIKYGDLADLDPDVWCFGHWHKNQGITTLENGKLIVNVGSLSRGTLSQDDVDRIPEVVALRFHPERGATAEAIPLDVQPPEEVFDIEGRARAESRTLSVDAFVEGLQETLARSENESLEDVVRGLPDVPEAVRERALSYLERARGS